MSKNYKAAHHDEFGEIAADCVDLNAILDNIDACNGRNDALRAYIFGLRDLQRAYGKYGGCDEIVADSVEHAKAAANAAFDRLIVCEFSLNRATEMEDE